MNIHQYHLAKTIKKTAAIKSKCGYRTKMLNFKKTNKHLTASLYDCETQNILFSISTISFKKDMKKTWNITAATVLGDIFSKKCLEKGIKEIFFNRGTLKYHGIVAAMADAARKNGLSF